MTASVRGESHRRIGRGNDDAYQCVVAESGHIVAALADGAGSADMAELGSKEAALAAVEESLEFLRKSSNLNYEMHRDFVHHIFQNVHNNLRERASALNTPLSSLATTLLLCVAGPDGAIIAQIGDGCTVLLHPVGRLMLPIPPQSGEYINQTNFITDTSWPYITELMYCRYVPQAIVMFTDGLEPIAYEQSSARPFAPFINGIIEFASKDDNHKSQLEEFLSSPRVASRTDDDRSIIVATHR